MTVYGKDEKAKMLSGKLYHVSGDERLAADEKKCRRLVRLYNALTEDEKAQRLPLLKQLLGGCGTRCTFEPPVHFDYGCHTYIGEHFYANFDCVILDVCKVTIGEQVRLGPRVSIFTVGHPIDPDVRAEGFCCGKPVTIGNNVWVGGHTVINPGVTIGDNTVIGSGSVVTKDIPPNVIAAGVPCRVIRAITPEDRAFWEAQREEYLATNE
ncbi:MAG: sugar O-acetyltransferase [Clostridia bacterium]|nr:sugar O-acetyltransferase [Clostridia bacterium]MBQ1412814.1 sugar O-acetyltransferase [Clostridia bacterium]MBQ4397206.1 sugar O-acetyltransferase [Clostridia bacterium]